METKTLTLSEFLLARIAEDGATARAATHGPWEACTYDSGHSRYELSATVITAEHGDRICDMDGLGRINNEVVAKDDGSADAYHIARHDPARVLAECEAKRAIVGTGEFPTQAVKILAAIYADHPDYDEAWRP